MIREEKRWITPDPVVLPEFVGEVQDETTASAVAGDDLTIDGGGVKGSPAVEPATAPATEPATEPATAPATEPATEPAYKPSPVFTPSPVLEPDTAPGVGVLKKPEPAIDPVWQPWGATQPQTVPSLVSKAKPIENKAKLLDEPATSKPKITLRDVWDYETNLIKETGYTWNSGAASSANLQKVFGISKDTADTAVNITRAIGAAEFAALTAPIAVSAGGAAVAKGGEVIKQGAQTLDDLIEGVKAGRTAFGGAY